MTSENEKPVPIEMCFLKTAAAKRDGAEIIEKFAETCKNQCSSENSKYPILFGTYGWFDALMIVINPKCRCCVPDEFSKYVNSSKGEDSIMKTSFVGWYYESHNKEYVYPEYSGSIYHKKVKKVREKLWSLTKGGRDGEKIVWDSSRPKGLHVLSFVKLSEDNANLSKSNNSTRDEELEEILERFMIVDYLGLWDIVILARLKKYNYELLEEYKNNFLITADEILQSSSIVLTPFNKNEVKIMKINEPVE